MSEEQQTIEIPENILRIICEHGGHHEAPRALKLWRCKIHDHETMYATMANTELDRLAQSIRIQAIATPLELDYILQHAIVKDGKIVLEGDIPDIFDLNHLQATKRLTGYDVQITASPYYIQYKGKSIAIEPHQQTLYTAEFYEPLFQIVNTDDYQPLIQKEVALEIQRFGMRTFYYHLPRNIYNLLGEYQARLEAELKIGGGYTIKD